MKTATLYSLLAVLAVVVTGPALSVQARPEDVTPKGTTALPGVPAKTPDTRATAPKADATAPEGSELGKGDSTQLGRTTPGVVIGSNGGAPGKPLRYDTVDSGPPYPKPPGSTRPPYFPPGFVPDNMHSTVGSGPMSMGMGTVPDDLERVGGSGPMSMSMGASMPMPMGGMGMRFDPAQPSTPTLSQLEARGSLLETVIAAMASEVGPNRSPYNKNKKPLPLALKSLQPGKDYPDPLAGVNDGKSITDPTFLHITPGKPREQPSATGRGPMSTGTTAGSTVPPSDAIVERVA